jgi:hypothetical protein
MCYLLILFTSLGVGNVKLILINGGFSILTLGISILVMYVWLTWIDLVYPLIATWLFLFLIIAMRRIGRRMVLPPPAEDVDSMKEGDRSSDIRSGG